MATPEGKIQLAILKWLQSQSIYCWRNANATRYDASKGMYLYNPQHKVGLGDIVGVLPGGRYFEIEVKTPTGRQSHAQQLHQKRLEDEGAVYILARSLDEVKNHAIFNM